MRIKRLWWSFKKETKYLSLWAMTLLPGSLGQHMRAWLMPYFLKRLGTATVIKSAVRISSPEKVSIGSHCNFATGVFITGGGGVKIGDWVGFGPDVKVWSVNHRFEDADRPWLLQGWDYKEVHIEDDVWLGANTFVMPGVTIGKGAIVSAGSVVNKSIPAYALVAGNPARVVGWRKKLATDREISVRAPLCDSTSSSESSSPAATNAYI